MISPKMGGKKLLGEGDQDTFSLKTDLVHQNVERKGFAEITQCRWLFLWKYEQTSIHPR